MTAKLLYLADAAATNLQTYSNATTGASATNTTFSTATGADGGQTAIRITETATTALHYAQWPTITKAASAIQYTGSAVVHGGTRRYVGLVIGDTAGNGAQVTFDTTTGTISAAATGLGTPFTGISAAIVPYGSGGRWLISLTCTSNTATTLAMYPTLSNDGTNIPSYAGAVDKYADFESLQIETGAVATSRIATGAASVTRNADVLTYTGGDIANLKSLACTFERKVGVSGTGIIAELNDGTTNELATMYMNNATDIRWQGTDGGVVQWNLPLLSYTAGAQAKVAQSWATNDVKGSRNGTACTPDTVATIPTVTALNVGHQNGAFQLQGNVGGIYGWTRNLSQSELNAITS